MSKRLPPPVPLSSPPAPPPSLSAERNRNELLIGSIVIIAGVAFVTLSAGAGMVVLAPIVLVAG